MNSIITVSGSIGSGKTTIAKQLAEQLGMRYWSSGTLFRQMAKERGLSLEGFQKLAESDSEFDKATDKAAKRAAEESSVVLDGHITGWTVGKKATLRIFLTAPASVRAKRIAERDGLTYDEALQSMRTRQESNRKRYIQLYHFDVEDLEIYDMVINTQTWNPPQVLEILKFALKMKLVPSTEKR